MLTNKLTTIQTNNVDYKNQQNQLEIELLNKALNEPNYKSANKSLSIAQKKQLQIFLRGDKKREIDGIIGRKTRKKAQEKKKELENGNENIETKGKHKSILIETAKGLTNSKSNILKQTINIDKPYNIDHKGWTPEKKRENARIIADRLSKEFGLKDYQIAGIIGSLIHESSLNPAARNKAGRDFGIAQRANVRRKALYKFAGKSIEDEKKLTPIDFDTQLDYMIKEMMPGTGNRRGATKAVKNAKDIEEATNVFTNLFEAPAVKATSYTRRIKLAKEAYKKLYG